jgi:hypothetical protein
MDILTIALIVLAILALSGWGYGRYSAVPADAAMGPAPWVNPLGILGLVLLIAVVVLLLGGFQFGLSVAPPP